MFGLRSLGQARKLRWMLSISLSLGLMIPTATVAKYRPNNPSSPKSDGTTTGRRGGCESKTEGSLTALAPIAHVGKSVSTHPTFAWYVPETKSRNLVFKLHKLTQSGEWELIYSDSKPSHAGIMQVSLPQTKPKLEAKQLYLWQAVLQCKPGSPSADLLAEAQIEIVPSSTDLTAKLQGKTGKFRAETYAELGIWYDALAEYLTLSQSSIPRSLLNDLATIESSSTLPEAQEQLIRIQQLLSLKPN